jgi:hydroxymethylglutaryl-CoA synthase
MASDAGKAALEMAEISRDDIGAIYLGTCTNPYVTKASVTFVAESLDLKAELFSCDCQFGSKSGTSGMQICTGIIAGGIVDYGIAIGSDSLISHTAPNDWPMEYSSSAGAAAYVIGSSGIIAEIEQMHSFATETTDFFRLDGDRYIGRAVYSEEEFVGYNKHITSAVKGFMEKFGFKARDFSHVVLHQKNGIEPITLGKDMGFTEEQLRSCMVADRIGDCGSANSLIALALVLDKAKPGEKILLASYGHGAGSDVLSFKVTELIDEARKRRKNYPDVEEQIRRRVPITYSDYLKMQRKMIQEYV